MLTVNLVIHVVVEFAVLPSAGRISWGLRIYAYAEIISLHEDMVRHKGYFNCALQLTNYNIAHYSCKTKPPEEISLNKGMESASPLSSGSTCLLSNEEINLSPSPTKFYLGTRLSGRGCPSGHPSIWIQCTHPRPQRIHFLVV